MRFLHLADVHLDTAFRSRSRELAEELRRASRTALERAVEEAIRRNLDAVLIAGDLFDSERLSVQTERFLVETLDRLVVAGIQVVYATGNHDPGGTSGAGSGLEWPERVSVIEGPEPTRVEIRREGVPVGYVTAAGHASARVTEDLSAAFPRPEGPLPHVALLHTQVVGARREEEHDPYAPSALPYLRSAGYDYWALGHVHQRQALSHDPPIHYPGNTQGRNPREAGAKGGLVVDLSHGGLPQVEFVELGPVRWEVLALRGLESEERLSGLAQRIETAWAAAREADPGEGRTRWILRVHLSGPSPLSRVLATPEGMEELREVLVPSLGLLEVDLRASGLRPVQRVGDHLDRGDVLGEALRLARELADPDGPSPSAALELQGRELAGPIPPDRPLDDYLRELLQGADESILEALSRKEGA